MAEYRFPVRASWVCTLANGEGEGRVPDRAAEIGGKVQPAARRPDQGRSRKME
jgi:hypothetical protein